MRVCEHETCKKYLYPNCTSGSYCAGCAVVSYCSDECKRADNGRHRQECERLKQEAEASFVPVQQVYGQAGPPSLRPAARAGATSRRDSAGSTARRVTRSMAAAAEAAVAARQQAGRVRPMCGLCGNCKGPFVLTECCRRLVCADGADYIPFSGGRNSCSRNHSSHTLCYRHFSEEHGGRWQDCESCRSNGDPYDIWRWSCNPPGQPENCNFADEALDEPRPPLPCCSACGRGIDTGREAYTLSRQGMKCEGCDPVYVY